MIIDYLNEKLKPLIIRPFASNDYDALFELHKGNVYYNSCIQKEQVTKKQVLDGLTETPPEFNIGQKFYLGFFSEAGLIACIDYLEGYPINETVFLGLLMTGGNHQRQGFGTKIIQAFLAGAKENGYKKVRLACLENNLHALSFWQKSGFQEKEHKTSRGFSDNICN